MMLDFTSEKAFVKEDRVYIRWDCAQIVPVRVISETLRGFEPSRQAELSEVPLEAAFESCPEDRDFASCFNKFWSRTAIPRIYKSRGIATFLGFFFSDLR